MSSIIGWLTHVVKTEVEPGAVKYINYESKKCKMNAYWDILDVYNHIKSMDFSNCNESEIRWYIRGELRYFNYADENHWYKIFKVQEMKIITKIEILNTLENRDGNY